MIREAASSGLLVLLLAASASADPTPSPHVDERSFGVKLMTEIQDKRPSGTSGGSNSTGDAPIRRVGDTTPSACAGAGHISVVAGANGPEITYCPADAAPAVVTIGMVRTAFASLPLPGSKLTIQPPDGLTLVNFDTNFYTADTQAITSNVTLLGQAVTIEATPDQFTWHFGDDTTKTTTDPGAAYPDLRVTHNYLKKATYRPSLTTTYTGRFKVGNSPWRTIPGTVTINGPKQRLRAIEATPKLTGY